MKIIKLLAVIFILINIVGCPDKKIESQASLKSKNNSKEDQISEVDPVLFEVGKIVMFSDWAVVQNTFKDDEDSLKIRIQKNKEEIKFLDELVSLITKMIYEDPYNCSLYALRSYIAAITHSEELMFHDTRILEQFDPDEWATKFLMAYVYFQQWKDDKAVEYLDSGLKSYCDESSEEICSESSDDYVYNIIPKIKKRINEENEGKMFRLSKFKLNNRDNCYFMEVNKKNNKEGESVSWSGKCIDGWAEGKGELVYEKSGSRIKVFMKKGFMSGKVEMFLENGKRVVGEAKKGVPNGRWVTYDQVGNVIEDVHKDEKGRQGKGLSVYENFKFQGIYRNNFKTRDGVFVCFPNKKNETEAHYSIYRYTIKNDQRLRPFCGTPKSFKTVLYETRKIYEKEFEIIKKHVKNSKLDSSNCTPYDGFNSIKEQYNKD